MPVALQGLVGQLQPGAGGRQGSLRLVYGGGRGAGLVAGSGLLQAQQQRAGLDPGTFRHGDAAHPPGRQGGHLAAVGSLDAADEGFTGGDFGWLQGQQAQPLDQGSLALEVAGLDLLAAAGQQQEQEGDSKGDLGHGRISSAGSRELRKVPLWKRMWPRASSRRLSPSISPKRARSRAAWAASRFARSERPAA